MAAASSLRYRAPARTRPATSVVFPDSIGAGNSAARPSHSTAPAWTSTKSSPDSIARRLTCHSRVATTNDPDGVSASRSRPKYSA